MTEPAHVSFPALGGSAVVAAADVGALDGAVAAVKGVIEAIDLACSRFREDSELSAINAAGGRPVRVSALMLEAVEASLRAARLTGGDVDPTIGGALVSLGYDRDFDDVLAGSPRALPRRALATVPGWRTVLFDRDASTVRVPAGVVLDLGATAKALAADRAAKAALAAGGCGVLVSLSGDMAIAGESPPEGWRVRVTDDHRAGADAPGQTISLRSGGLATSSTTVRRWETSSGPAHHVLDPATGSPARETWRTVSVAAASCLDANIASTAAIVRGESAADWLAELRLPARLVDLAGTVSHIGGWPSDGEELPVRDDLVMTEPTS